MFNKVFDLSVNFMWESIFGESEFCLKYWDSRKFSGFKPEGFKWTKISNIMKRKLEYFVDLGVTFGRATNIEEQVSVKFLFLNYVCLVSLKYSVTKKGEYLCWYVCVCLMHNKL